MIEWGRGGDFGLCLTITILIHDFLLLFIILSQKEKLLCQKKKQYSVKLHDFYSYFMSNKIYILKRAIIYQSGITMNMSNT